jgi:CBS domain-containing protein
MLRQLREPLRRHAPFAQMRDAELDALLRASQQAYYEAGETLLEPESGTVTQLAIIRKGRVGSYAADGSRASELAEGDCFPIAALLAQRATTTRYRAEDDTFVLWVPQAVVQQLVDGCPAFADFAQRRVRNLLEISRRQLSQAYAQHSLAEQSLETRLADLVARSGRAPLTCAPDTPLAQALRQMDAAKVGSILVVQPATEGSTHDRVAGILTRHDLLARVVLPQVPLATPIGSVMSSPVHCLRGEQTAQDAAIVMSRHGIRHVPVLDEAGALRGVVSERDLFSLQRLSLRNVSARLRNAGDRAALVAGAADIRALARNLLAQGVQARQITALISHLNDVLTERLVQLTAAEHGIAPAAYCWLAFGSEGRGEQTIATDQDNGLVFDGAPDERERYMAFGRSVNEALADCGFPLCKGGIMAGQPACCRTRAEWLAQFRLWIERGTPEDLLNANVFFDWRATAGNAALVDGLGEEVAQAIARTPRFLHLMSANALRNPVALNWLGGVATTTVQGQATLDLKMQGTAPFVEAARIFALAHGQRVTNTGERLKAVAKPMRVPEAELASYVEAFEFLLLQRLRVQIEGQQFDDNPNRVALERMSELDLRILKEAVRLARKLQQRLQLDFPPPR